VSDITSILIAALLTRLTVNLRVATVYEATSYHDVAAGIGAFDGSLVSPTLKSSSGVLPFWILASAYGLVNNPQFVTTADPVYCAGDSTVCNSYLFPGGLQTILPSLNVTDPSPFVVVHNSPAIQMDFQQGADLYHEFPTGSCLTYGNSSSKIGIELCIQASPNIPGGVKAGTNCSIASRRTVRS
jgi:hypothetical protein